MKGVFAGLMAMAWAAGAMADGNALLAQCQVALKAMDEDVSQGTTFDAGICLGKVSTVIDMMQGLRDDLPPKYKVCLPEQGIQYGQGIRIVTKYLNEHPKFLHLDDTILIMKALQTSYPCR
ncbi:hypothetical protein D3C84_862980 [compost metagenome]